MADKVFKDYSFSDIHNDNYILQELLDEYAKLTAEIEKNRWVPVGEGLPEEDIDVFVYRPGRIRPVGTGHWYKRPNGVVAWSIDGTLNLKDINITHWKPITLPSKETSQ